MDGGIIKCETVSMDFPLYSLWTLKNDPIGDRYVSGCLWCTWCIMLNITGVVCLNPVVVFFQVEGDLKQSEQAQLLVKVSLGSKPFCGSQPGGRGPAGVPR